MIRVDSSGTPSSSASAPAGPGRRAPVPATTTTRGCSFDRCGVGDLQHHVNVVDAAIDDRRRRVHQRLVHVPRRAGALLVEVQAEDVGSAKVARLGDQALTAALGFAWTIQFFIISIGIGLAIPAEQAKPIVDKLMRGQAIERGYLGVGIQPLTPDLAQGLNLGRTPGAFFTSVTQGSPAARAGVPIPPPTTSTTLVTARMAS